MFDIIRDSTAGQIIRFASGGRVFLYPEERPSWQWPTQYLSTSQTSPGRQIVQLQSFEASIKTETNGLEASQSPQPEDNLVEWYDENDAENPQNWSLSKKLGVASLIK